MPSGGAMHEIKNIKDSKVPVPVNALYSTPFRDDTEVHRKSFSLLYYTKDVFNLICATLHFHFCFHCFQRHFILLHSHHYFYYQNKRYLNNTHSFVIRIPYPMLFPQNTYHEYQFHPSCRNTAPLFHLSPSPCIPCLPFPSFFFSIQLIHLLLLYASFLLIPSHSFSILLECCHCIRR